MNKTKEAGVTLLEYTIMLGLAFLVIATAIPNFQDKIEQYAADSQESINSATAYPVPLIVNTDGLNQSNNNNAERTSSS